MTENNINYIPANIKKIQTSKGFVSELVFSIRDMKILSQKNKILQEYNNLVNKIILLWGNNRPSCAPIDNIWEIGYSILKTRDLIRSSYGVDITNITEAVSKDVNYSYRAVQYMVQFSIMLPKEKIIQNISWGKYQEAIKIKKQDDFLECLEMMNNGILKTTPEIRKYVREINRH